MIDIKKIVMIIGAGKLQVPLIQICKKNGYKVVVTDKYEDAVGLKYADDYMVVDGTDKEKILEYAQRCNIDGIVTTSEITLFTVAYVCEKLGLRGPSIKAAQISNDKYFMRKCMSESEMESPKCWLINNITELNKIECEISFPVIVKPVDASGSLGVIKVNSLDEIRLVFDEVLTNARNNKIIIEEFLEGPEVSVETLSQSGKHNIIAITEENISGNPYFVEERYVIPAKISEKQKKQIKDMVVRFLDICDFDNCAAHIEIKLTKYGPRVIETGARICGDYVASDLVPLATGISMYENIIKIALGEEIDISKKLNRYAGIQFITPNNYELIVGRSEFSKNKDFIKYELSTNNYKNKLKSSLDRLGYYICKADTREKLIKKLDFYKQQ